MIDDDFDIYIVGWDDDDDDDDDTREKKDIIIG